MTKGNTVVLICGGRDYSDRAMVRRVLETLRPSMVIHGGAPGADQLADEEAMALGIHAARVPALWSQHGKAAGPMRNKAMLLLHPSMVVAFPGGRGTDNMRLRAHVAGVPVYSAEDVVERATTEVG